MAQTNYTPIQLYSSATASAVPLAANLAAGELAINTLDGKLYYKNSAGVVTLLASTAGSSGDVVGPASATDNALARFDLTTGKLIQNSVGILSDAGVLTGLTGITSSGSITLSSLTSGRVTFAGASGLLTDSANLTFSGTILTSTGFAGPLDGTVGATTANTGAFTTLSATGVATFSAGTVSLPAITTTGDTNTGIFFPAADTIAFAEGGVEAMRINSSGKVGIGLTSYNLPLSIVADGNGQNIQINGRTGDDFGQIFFRNFGGANNLARIASDSNAGLVFGTGSQTAPTVPTERMRIDSSGNVGIGTTSFAANLDIGKTLTGATSWYGIRQNGTIQSDVTSGVQYNRTVANTAASAFTLSNLWHYIAVQSTIGAGSAVTNQYGFAVDSTLIGATNNYGFYSNIASAANRYNFYANGTAQNYMAGNLSIGTTTSTSMLLVAGSSSVSAFKTPNIAEVNTISATAATGTINYDVTTQSVLYYTTNASGNFTVNFRGSSGTTLNTVMQTGESISATFLVTNGATAYYNSAVQVDGSSVTPKWQGGTAPTSGNASSIDSYTYVIIKTGSAAFTVLASVTKFA